MSLLGLILRLRAFLLKEVGCNLAEEAAGAANAIELSSRGVYDDVEDPSREIMPHQTVEQLWLGGV